MKYDALIFDMDGTLVHNMTYHDQAFLDTLAEAGVQIQGDVDEFFRSIYGKKNQDIMRELLGSRFSEAEVTYWNERKEALYREKYACCREPLPGLLEMLEQAQALGLTMAVASSAPPDNISFILDELDLRRYFNAVVSGQDVRHGKPQPDIFLKSAQILGVEPQDCLVFEDAPGGIEAARRAGMDAILITTTIDAQETDGLPHVLRAVADFTHINPPELLGLPEA